MTTPSNLDVFLAAYSGAVSGMEASGRVLKDNRDLAYLSIVQTAFAFAEAFDSTYALYSATANELQIETIMLASEAVWQDRQPPNKPLFKTPAAYSAQCEAIVAVVQAGDVYFASQGITPPPWGGGSNPSSLAPTTGALGTLSSTGESLLIDLASSNCTAELPVITPANGVTYNIAWSTGPAASGLTFTLTDPLGANIESPLMGPGLTNQIIVSGSGEMTITYNAGLGYYVQN